MTITVKEMKPYVVPFELSSTALLIIDMQRDFLEPGGFGEELGNDVTKLQRCIEPCSRVLSCCRDLRDEREFLIIHTREGHRADLTDVHPWKQQRSNGCIGRERNDSCELGRILIRGEMGHDIIPELYPLVGKEPIIDKPGKGAFYETDLHLILQTHCIKTLLVCGVTSEVCVQTTVREANDRGYHCIVIEDACASYNDTFHKVSMDMIAAQGGIFGSIVNSQNLIEALWGE